MTNPKSGEEFFERLDHVVNDVALYPSKGDAAIPPRGCRPLPEGYAEGQEGVHVHLRVEAFDNRHMGGIRRDLCAVFKRTEKDVHGAGQMGHVGKVSVGGDGHLRNVRHSMLVHVVKLLQLPEGVRRELVPSIVRLKTLDDCLRVWVDAPDFVAAFPFRHLPVAKDGELQFSRSVLGQGVDADVRQREFVDEVVESGTEVVQAIPDDEAELRWNGFREFEVDELLTALSVEMTDVSVRFSLSPLAHLRVEAVQVMGGPI